MFTKTLLAAVSGALVLFANMGVVRADTWAEPTPAIFGTESGRVACKILPTGRRLMFGQPSMAEIFKLDKDGKGVVVRRFVLVNIPYKVVVINGGEFLVTVDTYGRLGYEHSVVIYNKAGQLVADLTLEDFLGAQDIQTVSRTASSRDWAIDAKIRSDLLNESLLIDLPTGKKLSIELKTGKVSRRNP